MKLTNTCVSSLSEVALNMSKVSVGTDLDLSDLPNHMTNQVIKNEPQIVYQNNAHIIPAKPIEPVLIRTRGPATIVDWNDGTTTKVVNADHFAPPDVFCGFCAAYAKKMFGSTKKLLDVITNADEVVLRCRQNAAKEEAEEIRKEQMEKKAAKKLKHDIKRELYRLRVKEEAEKKFYALGTKESDREERKTF